MHSKMRWSWLVGLLWLLVPHQEQATSVTWESAIVNISDIFTVNFHIDDAVDHLLAI